MSHGWALAAFFGSIIIVSGFIYQLVYTDLLAPPKGSKKAKRKGSLGGKKKANPGLFAFLVVVIAVMGWMIIDNHYLPINPSNPAMLPIAWVQYHTGIGVGPSAAEEEAMRRTEEARARAEARRPRRVSEAERRREEEESAHNSDLLESRRNAVTEAAGLADRTDAATSSWEH